MPLSHIYILGYRRRSQHVLMTPLLRMHLGLQLLPFGLQLLPLLVQCLNVVPELLLLLGEPREGPLQRANFLNCLGRVDSGEEGGSWAGRGLSEGGLCRMELVSYKPRGKGS